MKDMIYFAGQQVAQRVVSGSVVSYYFNDQVGSVRLMVDATATTCWDADYYPFGGWNIFGAINCQPQYRYTEMETEPTMSTDVDYAMYRYYSHRFARFMSPDPVGGDPANPQSWNRYAYALNSPASLVDPLGLDPCHQPDDCPKPPPPPPPNGTDSIPLAQCTQFFGSFFSYSHFLLNYGDTCWEGMTQRRWARAFKPGVDQDDDTAPPPKENCTPGTKGCFNVPTAQQQALGCGSNSLIDKGIREFSLLRIGSTWKEWTVGGGAKYGAVKLVRKWGVSAGADIAAFDTLVTFSGGLGALVVLGSTLLDAPCFMAPNSGSSPQD